MQAGDYAVGGGLEAEYSQYVSSAAGHYNHMGHLTMAPSQKYPHVMDGVSVGAGVYGTYGHYGATYPAHPAQPAYLVDAPNMQREVAADHLAVHLQGRCLRNITYTYNRAGPPLLCDVTARRLPRHDSQNGLSLGSTGGQSMYGDEEELQKQMAGMSLVHGAGVGRDEGAGLQWRDPNLPEVIGFLNSPSDVVARNACGALRNLTSDQRYMEHVLVRRPQAVHHRRRRAVFRNASGVLRNVSSAGEYARRRLRSLAGLPEALLHVVRAAIATNAIGTKIVENCVCVLRNLSYRCQEIEDPLYDTRAPPTQSTGQARIQASGSKGSKKKKEGSSSNSTSPLGKSETETQSLDAGSSALGYSVPKGTEMLWSPEVVPLYMTLLQTCSNPETLEAAAGALQNLAASSNPGGTAADGGGPRGVRRGHRAAQPGAGPAEQGAHREVRHEGPAPSSRGRCWTRADMWSHAELREVYRKHGWREADFLTPARAAPAPSVCGCGVGAGQGVPHSPGNTNSTLSRPMASTGGTRYEDRTIRRHRETASVWVTPMVDQ
ncbi:unnamed protein product [Leptidea sinapis]|uniref:Uncharacterized protein n=1 Tax=Leptidea sinapis TaxID=189913 RepID=A0A5E4PVG4_9NEOP|nr:unnamed protein product [Leptidea sinapis]